MMLNLTKLALLFYLPIFLYTISMTTSSSFLTFFKLQIYFNSLSTKFWISRSQSKSAAHWGFFFTVLSMTQCGSFVLYKDCLYLGYYFNISLKPTASTPSLSRFCKASWILNYFLFNLSSPLPNLHNLQSLLCYNSLAITQLLSFYLQIIYVLN